ncbi:T9SS C-terminal target domain-containing protein [Bacteroidetes/Chlorobi group bacterium ChocPot_Mid]|nr:MAG: T9SS C-terminal target domain-containing protein [Bacteroidetes/Chlorobi group bacterium ChocPot_Mid]
MKHLIITAFLLAIFLFALQTFSSAQTIAAGMHHSLALKNDGTVWAWGSNSDGQLGDGTNTDSHVPVKVDSLKSIIAIARGCFHSLALKNDGTVWAWGWNKYGQLGYGTSTDISYVPVQVDSLTSIIAIAAGMYHSLALKNDGTVWAWGYNNHGQLGNGTNTDSNVPVQVTSLTSIIAIAGGYGHSLALKSDGTVWAWGYTYYSNVPVKVDSLKSIIAIAGGWWHSLALKNDGTVWAWGNNNLGQLGNGTNTYTYSNVPVKVDSLTSIIAIAAGGWHSLALKSDGTVWAWGYNNYGQLGNGTNTDSNVPVKVDSLTSIIAIAGGVYHSLALKNDGTVWAWGFNQFGQLGDGTNTNSNVPVQTSITNVLPVELTSFSASVSNGSVLLNWQTATEVNNYGFEIERASQTSTSPPKARKLNLIDWNKIGFVQGHGNSNSPKDYFFTDENPPSGKVQYRLKQIDFDGSFKYSDIVEANVDFPQEFKLAQNFPNPFNPTTKIEFTIPQAANVSLKVYNVLGQEVRTLVNGMKEAGTYKINFDAKELSNGVYIYKLEAGTYTQARKMILMK